MPQGILLRCEHPVIHTGLRATGHPGQSVGIMRGRGEKVAEGKSFSALFPAGRCLPFRFLKGVMEREVGGRDLLIVWVSMHTLTHLHAAVSLWKGTLFVLVTKLLQGGIPSLLISHQPRLVNHLRAAVGNQ